MPWQAGRSKTDKGWPIYKKVNGKKKIVGYSDTRKGARDSVKARYANTKKYDRQM